MIPNVNCIVQTRIRLCEGCPVVGAYLNMVVVSLVCKLCLVFCTFSLKNILVLFNFFCFCYAKPSRDLFPLMEVSFPGVVGQRGLSVMGCQTSGANLYTD
ncbi:hypothetical protein KUCAC02_007560 [Chaenocephalus aceratus]|uniref:Uncharacterized protein n=1 Tax=Chaenocephalus aceratus TaxID=36190 RepID=A0ACB9X6I0_CHAAC|nr:hypothetical protein KUCAC02_007560 [Chaenocephalus aceratus]